MKGKKNKDICLTYVCVSHPVVSNSLQPHGLQPARFLSPWNSPGKNTGVGCHVLPHNMCVLSHFSLVRLFVTPWTVAYQAPLSMGFSRQEYWRGLPCPPPGHLPNPGIELASLRSSALAGRSFTAHATWEVQYMYIC